ncbi:MAG: FlgD immunoglobulin-like domain containing protein [Candidatus Eisenbacteria bacterium]
MVDTAGRRVAALQRDAVYGAGSHRLTWDGVDEAGRALPTGVYYIRVTRDGTPAADHRVVMVR